MSFLCIGHRGASGHAPENTLKAFQLAIEMGCSWVELDVYAVEGELLVIHDDDVDRTTNGQGAVMAMSLAELRALDAGDGEQIPTLREVMKLCAGKVGINIELKGPGTAQPVNTLLTEMLLEGWTPEQIIISSFDHRELARADQQFQRGALFYKYADYVAAAQALGAVSINLAQKLVTAEAVQEAHQAGFQVWVYTVNSFDEMLAMKNLGVDAVFTNYPDQFPT
ncbi:MAG: glycerophosphodiester phosphodiesterase [Pseudomonadales bacterium]